MARLMRLTLALLALWGPSAAATTLPARASLTHGFAEALLRTALQDSANGDDFELRLDQPRLPLANQSAFATDVTVEGLRYEPASGRFEAILVGRVADETRFRLPAQGRAHALIEVPVLTRAIAPGERIGAADIDWRTVPDQRLHAGTITDAAEVIGAEARRRLRPGRLLGAHDVRPPRLVRRGRAVRLIYRRPGLQVSALGLAQDDGGRGDVVRVLNAASRQQVQGVVSGPDEITVGPAVPAPGAGRD